MEQSRDQVLNELQEAFTEALLNRDRRGASELISQAVDGGIHVRDIYLGVFQRSQYAIGSLWQRGLISVAQAHFCTALTVSIMGTLYPRLSAGPRNGRNFLGLCVSDELHDIGLRMVSDLLELDGWDTWYLGANVPIREVPGAIGQYRAHVVGISVTIASHLPKAVEMIAAIRAAPSGAGVKVLVGGYVFNTLEGLWRKVGADLYAHDAREACQVLNGSGGIP